MRLLLPLLMLCAFALPASAQDKLFSVDHIIVVYLENRSFDNVLGFFPGADGIEHAGEAALQVDAEGRPYQTLPPVLLHKKPDARFPATLENKPFPILSYLSANDFTDDPVHRFYQMQQQINGGAMNKFALYGGGLVMGYYDDEGSPLRTYAKKYTLLDHFFAGAMGGSFLNHVWLICACVPYWSTAPQESRAVLNERGELVKDGAFTPDGYAVNTIQPESPPYSPNTEYNRVRLPMQYSPTIGDRLSEKGISWAWYGGGWNDAVAGKPSDTFQFHHQPFAYFANYAAGTSRRKWHLKDEDDFRDAIKTGKLPQVVFYKPGALENLHPGYAKLREGEEYIFSLIEEIEKSPLFERSLIIVTFDEGGGFWDHVTPPVRDRFGPGVRVPTLLISPMHKGGHIDSGTYDTTSILRLIEDRFDLEPLNKTTRQAGDLRKTLR